MNTSTFCLLIGVLVTLSSAAPQGAEIKALPTPNLDLPGVVQYLKWVGSLNLETIITNGSDIIYEMEAYTYDFFSEYIKVMNENQDVIDANTIFDHYFETLNENYVLFYDASSIFMRAWADDYSTINVSLATYLNSIKGINSNISAEILTVHKQLDDYAHTFLPPPVFDNITILLDGLWVNLDALVIDLYTLIFPGASRPATLPKNIAVPDFIRFIEWVGKLKTEDIIYGALAQAKAITAERKGFELALYDILREAGETLEGDARLLVASYESLYNSKLGEFKAALDDFFYKWNYDSIWEALEALVVIYDVGNWNLANLPLAAISTIENLETLVRTAEPQFVERAEVLTQDTLDKVDVIVQNYLSNWKP